MLATNEQQDAEAAGDSSHASDKPVPTPPWHAGRKRHSKQGTGEDRQAVHQQEAQAGDNTHVDGEHHMSDQQQQNAEHQHVAEAQDSTRETDKDIQAARQQEVQAGNTTQVDGNQQQIEQQHDSEEQPKKRKKKRKHHVAAAQDINQKTGEDLQTVHQQEAQTVDSNQPAHQHGPHEENTEQPAQQHAAKEEMSESNISDDTDELIDRVRKNKRRRRRSSSTSNSEQYHHRKIQKHFQALGAKRYRRISNCD